MDVVVGNISKNLTQINEFAIVTTDIGMGLTRALKSAISSSVKVSALAMMGIKLTLVWSLRMNSMSICLRLFECILVIELDDVDEVLTNGR